MGTSSGPRSSIRTAQVPIEAFVWLPVAIAGVLAAALPLATVEAFRRRDLDDL